jgi:hypothetical protein
VSAPVWRIDRPGAGTVALRLCLDLGAVTAPGGEALAVEHVLARRLKPLGRRHRARVAVAAGLRYLTVGAHCRPAAAAPLLAGVEEELARGVGPGEWSAALRTADRGRAEVESDPVELVRATLAHLSGDWALSPWAAAAGLADSRAAHEPLPPRLGASARLLIAVGEPVELPEQPAVAPPPPPGAAGHGELAVRPLPLGRLTLCGVGLDLPAAASVAARRSAARALGWLLHGELRERLRLTYGVSPLAGEHSIAAFWSCDRARAGRATAAAARILREVTAPALARAVRVAAGEERMRLLSALQTTEGTADELVARAGDGCARPALEDELDELASLARTGSTELFAARDAPRFGLVGALPRRLHGRPLPAPWLGSAKTATEAASPARLAS